MMMQTNLFVWCKRIVLVVMLSALAVSAQAQSHTVNVPVEDRSNGVRAQAEKTALAEMLTRLTGQVSVNDLAGVDAILENAGAWVDQYSYVEIDQQQYLSFGFNEAQLREELANVGAPLWSAVRPEVVVWWVKQHRDLVSQEQATEEAHQGLLAQAGRRGVPLKFPLMDSEDKNRIAASDVRGQFYDQIARATERYNTALALAVLQESDQRLRWQLLSKQQVLESGTLAANQEQHLGEQLATAVANALGERFAVAGGEVQEFTLAVKGINALQHWRQFEQTLYGQAGVKHINLRALEAHALLLEVAYAGEPEQFKRVLLLGNELSSCPNVLNAELTLCWH